MKKKIIRFYLKKKKVIIIFFSFLFFDCVILVLQDFKRWSGQNIIMHSALPSKKKLGRVNSYLCLKYVSFITTPVEYIRSRKCHILRRDYFNGYYMYHTYQVKKMNRRRRGFVIDYYIYRRYYVKKMQLFKERPIQCWVPVFKVKKIILFEKRTYPWIVNVTRSSKCYLVRIGCIFDYYMYLTY